MFGKEMIVSPIVPMNQIENFEKKPPKYKFWEKTKKINLGKKPKCFQGNQNKMLEGNHQNENFSKNSKTLERKSDQNFGRKPK